MKVRVPVRSPRTDGGTRVLDRADLHLGAVPWFFVIVSVKMKLSAGGGRWKEELSDKHEGDNGGEGETGCANELRLDLGRPNPLIYVLLKLTLKHMTDPAKGNLFL